MVHTCLILRTISSCNHFWSVPKNLTNFFQCISRRFWQKEVDDHNLDNDNTTIYNLISPGNRIHSDWVNETIVYQNNVEKY